MPTRPGESMRVEHEYGLGGAWAYLAALDVHRAKVFGQCAAATVAKLLDASNECAEPSIARWCCGWQTSFALISLL